MTTPSERTLDSASAQVAPSTMLVAGSPATESTVAKALSAGAPTNLLLRCRLGWHRWTKWGEPVGLLGKKWNRITNAYNDASIIQMQVSCCSDCNAFRQREVSV